MGADLFEDGGKPSGAPRLTIFKAELIGRDEATWKELFGDFSGLQAITFSSSLEFLVHLVPQFLDVEIVFGSERILSKEHLALTQASQIVESYGFKDSLADQKALVEALAGLLGRVGGALLDRVAAGSVRFRLLKGKPSHEKLYLLSAPDRRRVITGSANLSLAAFAGRQEEILTVFDGTGAWELFAEYYRRDCKDSVSVDAELLVLPRPDGGWGARTTPLALEEVPVVRALDARVAVVDQPPAPMPAGFAMDALRNMAALGAELRDLSLPQDKNGCTMVNAGTVVRVIRAHQARPVADAATESIPRAEIDFARGTVLLNGKLWLGTEQLNLAGRHRSRRQNLGRLPRKLRDLLRQCRRGTRRLLGIPGLALRRSGGSASPPGSGAGWPRSIDLSGLRRPVRTL